MTLHSKLKEAIREINRIFSESKSDQDKRYLQELINYINQYEGDIDLLMCQMQYETKSERNYSILSRNHGYSRSNEFDSSSSTNISQTNLDR